MKKLLILGLLAIMPGFGANWTLIRRVTQGAACIASAADAYTTIQPGLVETNPLLGKGTPQPIRISLFKAAICGGSIALAEINHHKYHSDGLEKVYTFSALGQTGLYGGLAIHNNSLKGTK